MFDNDILNKVLDTTKKVIGIDYFDHIKCLINTADKLPGNTTFKNLAILMTYGIKRCIKEALLEA